MAYKPLIQPGAPGELREAIEAFLKTAREPALLEPGEEMLHLAAIIFHWSCVGPG